MPLDLERILLKVLQPDPVKSYKDASALHGDLRAVVERRGPPDRVVENPFGSGLATVERYLEALLGLDGGSHGP